MRNLFGKQSTRRNTPGSFRHIFKGPAFVFAITLLLCGSLSSPSHAFKIGDMGEGIYGGFDLTLTYGAMFRVEDPDKSAQGWNHMNKDDANRNFDTGIVSSQFKALGELELKRDLEDGVIGFFGRGYALWDPIIQGASNDHDKPLSNNIHPQYGGPLGKNDAFSDKMEGRLGQDFDKLDAFVFAGLFQGTDHPFSVKLGWHVVNWGESAFILHGIMSAINPLDASKAPLPGTEIKELILPTNQVSAGIELTPSLSLQAYYQFDWEKTVPPPIGSYLAGNDWIGEPSTSVFVGPGGAGGGFPWYGVLDHVGRNDAPSDSGQFGFALNYVCEALGSTDFGLYFINYHRKLPDVVIYGLQGSPDPHSTIGSPALPNGLLVADAFDLSGYSFEYIENVQLIAASFNTVLPWTETAVSMELAYHHDIPVQTTGDNVGLPIAIMDRATGGSGIYHLSTLEDIWVGGITFNQRLPFRKIADEISFICEVGAVYTPDLEDGEFFRGNEKSQRSGFTGDPNDLGTQWSYGYKAKLSLDYFRSIEKMVPALSGTELKVTLSFNHDIGLSPIPATSFSRNAKSAGIKFDFTYLQNLTLGIGYNAFFGNDTDNVIGDKDNVTFSLKWRM
ncbi:MAG: DUF1302 family protein [Deltaproteobacteria bacterium]|nr:DUF1302 family protein [Deltaproteobacteria bacterium]